MQKLTSASVIPSESVPLQPEEVRPRRPNNAPIVTFDVDSDLSTMARQAASDKVTRMVDWSFGYRIDPNQLRYIDRAMAMVYEDRSMSFNQSTSWIRDFPIIFDIEVKKTHQPLDPEVQLAIWISGGLLKKRLMQWDRSMPMPGIAVEGSMWRMFLFFETGHKELVSNLTASPLIHIRYARRCPLTSSRS